MSANTHQVMSVVIFKGEEPMTDPDPVQAFYNDFTAYLFFAHVPQPSQYLQECYRLLHPSGHLVLTTHGIWPYYPAPTDSSWWTGESFQYTIQNANSTIVAQQSMCALFSNTVQRWQDATLPCILRFLRQGYITVLQAIIGAIEHRRHMTFSSNAYVYLIVSQWQRFIPGGIVPEMEPMA